MRRTRILVADPMRIFREGVRNLLVRESEFDVVETGSLDEALAVVECGAPDTAYGQQDGKTYRLGEFSEIERANA
jgi:CheY-like chemotaxis protein